MKDVVLAVTVVTVLVAIIVVGNTTWTGALVGMCVLGAVLILIAGLA